MTPTMAALPAEAGQGETVSAVVECPKSVHLGAPRGHERGAVFRRIRDRVGEAGSLLLGEAICRGFTQVTELQFFGRPERRHGMPFRQ